MSRPQPWLRLWFGFQIPVPRGTYLRHGLGLLAFKYAGDVLLVAIGAQRFWSPLEYVAPRAFSPDVTPAAPGLLLAQLAWSLPFFWIGVGMSMRRARDAGRSPWLALLFLVPIVKLALLGTLCALPSRPGEPPQPADPGRSPEGRVRAALVGITASLATGGLLTALITLVSSLYGGALFVALPFVVGLLTAFLYNRDADRGAGASVAVAQLALLLSAGLLVALAIEGVLCVAMAYPLAAGLVAIGALCGHALARTRTSAHAPVAALALVPVLAWTEPRVADPPREVRTEIVVDAPPESVWRHVVSFSELREPPRGFLRLGIAYPERATIEGSGVGAVRRCEFSTGAFVEPITAWEPPARLAFDVASQPPAMTEWSPYRALSPPHLRGTFRSVRGEFRLVRLPGERTRLEGRTWYVLAMTPRAYWLPWSDALLHAIHRRVLEHIRDELRATPPPAAPKPPAAAASAAGLSAPARG